ncbi:ATP-binding protein [Kitasatospora sp. CM 4170]|uniref:ATP-binding protein n=1 Tax=Kitasatospora aburaviensis TaxID=67265 RepID=A0ABW1EPB2_9ACTN|nr:ATP-binding protein [Kitasatospora sp. CM 4170]WNM45195.1 ATP-binding protein [Kitasatospora sp. CM 4170]
MDGQSRFPRQRTGSGDVFRPRAQGGTPGVPGAAGTAGPTGAPGQAGTAGTAGAGGRAQAGAPAPGCALHRRLHLALDPADLVAVGAVRHRLRSALSRWGVPELADTAELLSSELVTNALLHTGQGAIFEAVLGADLRLRIEVQDNAARLPGRRRDPDAEYATSGRGLMLVEALADDWGVQLRGDGKVTWFELATP